MPEPREAVERDLEVGDGRVVAGGERHAAGRELGRRDHALAPERPPQREQPVGRRARAGEVASASSASTSSGSSDAAAGCSSASAASRRSSVLRARPASPRASCTSIATFAARAWLS